MLKSKKTEVVKDLQDKLGKAQLSILADYKAMKVADMTQLRRQIKDAGGELDVVKNTLLKLASADTQLGQLAERFVGPTAVTFAYREPVEVAKVLAKFSKDKPDNFILKGGAMGRSVMTGAQVVELSKLPPREVLLSQLLAAMQAVPAGLVNLLATVIRQFLYTLKAVEEKKAGG